MPEMPSPQEARRAAALNALRYKKQTQDFRKDLFQQRENTQAQEDEDVPEQYRQRSRLALLKAGAIKKANSEAGGVVGATVGGTLGSVVPVIGTGIGAFMGRFIGKKAGITGIIIFVLLSMLFFLLMFVAVLKGACDTTAGKAANNTAWIASFGSVDICTQLK